MNKIIENPLSIEALTKKLSLLEKSPIDNGSLELIVARTSINERAILSEAEITIEHGLVGDRWDKGKKTTYYKKTQLTLMNSKVIEMISGKKENWSKVGDQLYVNFDISTQNLPAGQMIAFGSNNEVVLEITDASHRGCSKFSARFGREALQFINAPEWRELRLRGVYGRVVKSGKIKQNDIIRKI